MFSDRSMKEWARGISRGRKMLKFIERGIRPLQGSTIIDAGCGLGGITIAFSERCKLVVATDVDVNLLKMVKNRIRKRKIANVFLVCLDAAHLPFRDENFDLALMNGVLEWVPVKHREDPYRIQLKSLKEIHRVLKDDESLYLAIENRYFLPFFFGRKDPHSKLRFATVLPRRFARLYSNLVKKQPYQTYIYSFWGLKRLVEKSGFSATFYVGIRTYQFPDVIKGINDKKGLLEGCEEVLQKDKLLKIAAKTIVSLGFTKMFFQNFIAICSKCSSSS